ncbi:hypothetical protein ACIQM4_27940 [Streptomyces sp. NPDC091272]|uniref:hypothetical protein n=1 Tax=Streptomyces sp. NPDC091272 TaxID=3365981 RepID=UPI003815476A
MITVAITEVRWGTSGSGTLAAGLDAVTGVEEVQYADGSVALDTDGAFLLDPQSLLDPESEDTRRDPRLPAGITFHSVESELPNDFGPGPALQDEPSPEDDS